jgi:hypothetical protein
MGGPAAQHQWEQPAVHQPPQQQPWPAPDQQQPPQPWAAPDQSQPPPQQPWAAPDQHQPQSYAPGPPPADGGGADARHPSLQPGVHQWDASAAPPGGESPHHSATYAPNIYGYCKLMVRLHPCTIPNHAVRENHAK